MRTFIYPYKPYSASAKALAERLGVKRIRHKNSRFKPKQGDLIINWGASSMPHRSPAYVLNYCRDVDTVVNKLTFYKWYEGDDLPPFTEHKQVAIDWLRDGQSVVCRTILNGHSGEGIVIADTEEQIVDAPLYVKYIKKKDEYRIHLGELPNDQIMVIDVQRKARRLEEDKVDWRVRNHKNGFIYAREDVVVPKEVMKVAKDIFYDSYLSFGAVDVIYNEYDNRAYVLEINTAPGLSGQTLESYARFFEAF